MPAPTPPGLLDDTQLVLDFFNQDDLYSVAGDLNNIVHSINYGLLGQEAFSEKWTDSFDWDLFKRKLDGIDEEVGAGPGTACPSADTQYPKNIARDYLHVPGEREQAYLDEYFSYFSYLVLPFVYYDRESGHHVNPVRDVTLQKAANEPFLLAAVLAHGASALFSKQHRQEDQDAYHMYLGMCLKLLDPITKGGNEVRTINANIEAVLLTVLLLTSATAALLLSLWRPRLNGAKDLLLRHLAKRVHALPVLVLCKMWFVTLEFLAGISSTFGGTISLDAEMDLLFAMDDPYEIAVLRKWGIVDDTNFNYFVGIDHDLLATQANLIKLMRRVQPSADGSAPPPMPDNLFVLKVFGAMVEKLQITYMSEKCIVNKKSLSDKDNLTQMLTEEIDMGKTGQHIVCWKDISNQAYAMGGLIYLLIRFFEEPFSAPQVQELSQRLVRNVACLSETHYTLSSPNLFCAPIMIHWPMLVAGLVLNDKDQRHVIERYFEACQIRGLGALRYSLARVRRVWTDRDNGIHGDPLACDNSDTMSY